MFSNMKISFRLLLLISVLTLVFIANGAISLLGMQTVISDTRRLSDLTAESSELTTISASVRHHLVDVGQQLRTGALTWAEARVLLDIGTRHFTELWGRLEAKIANSPDEVEFFNDAFGIEVNLVNEGYRTLIRIVDAEDQGQLDLYLLNDASRLADPFLDSAEALTILAESSAREVVAQTEADEAFYLILSAAAIVIGLLLASTLGPLIFRSITRPITVIADTVDRVAEGDLEARTGLKSGDELGTLAQAFDNMLNERVSTMAKAARENEALNNSVISLLEAVSELSNRDLTVAVPVAEDVTGPVADAMNLMAKETARVLGEIRKISAQVAEAASTVESQGGKINHLADEERKIIEDTMTKLNEASKTMNIIARQAKASNEIAQKASSSTQQAFDSVTKTASGMNEIRETIAETEKRIKRLGERSQEINGIVEIINNIAERTHILALNASMQAAAAGDAGRGFAVVADEVQRLAESSRESTSEIAGLVGNIQAETAETMAAMNKAIAQVVDGTELAQTSGIQMKATQEATSELVNAVEQIAKRSLVQAHVSTNLLEQSDRARKSTEETNAELKLQADQTVNLVAFSKQLLESVNVFKLPA